MARNTQLPSNGNFLQSDLKKAIQKVLSRKQEAFLGIVGGAMLLGTAPALAQEQASEELDEVVVTGLRGSMIASMNIKREATGVVDAISAEDIGKFPDTNLAESLQRISGVSIDRVGGEGSRVTSRGFGPGFNLVTLNGRQMPTADVVVVGSGGDGEYGTFTSRSFDFSNLASEGVTGLEVFKTGRASTPSGGIGATINVKTMRPLTAGNKASFGAKAMFDTSVESGSDVTPEVTGLYSWANDSESFGVSLFGSYQKRDSASVGAGNQDWNVERLDRVPEYGQRPRTCRQSVNDHGQRSDRLQQHARRQSAGGLPQQQRLLVLRDRARTHQRPGRAAIPSGRLVHDYSGLHAGAERKHRKTVRPRATGSTVRSHASTSTRTTRW